VEISDQVLLKGASNMSDWKLSRRTFLKATGALGAAAAVGVGGHSLLQKVSVANAQAQAATGEEIKNSICDMCCIGYCGIQVLVKDGRATRVQSWADYPNGPICSKGNAILQQVYHPDRLKYPMKRTKPKGSADAGWVRISWDEAYTTIANKLAEMKQKYGAEKVVFYVGDPKEEPRPPAQRLGLAFGSPNYGTESSTCATSMQMAATLNGGGGLPISNQTKTVILWAKNPAWSMVRDVASQIFAIKDRGGTLIVVDPRLTPTAQLADIHLQLRPGTDGALALGMANVIINEGLYDADFVRDWTYGFDEFKEYVQAFTPEKVEEITWVPAAKIRQAARVYATQKPTSWVTTASPTVHHANGLQNQRAIGALIGLTGNVTVPGLSPSVAGVSVPEINDPGGLFAKLKGLKPDKKYFPLWWEMIEQLQMNKLPEYVKDGELKAGLWIGANFRMWPQSKEYHKAISDMEFTAGADFWMTPTMELMDIILPVATSLERLGPVKVAGRRVFLRTPVIQPIGEAKGDREWMFELAVKMGLGADFWNGSVEGSIDWQLEKLGLKAADLMKEPKGVVIPAGAPTPASDKPGFRTTTGKFEFYSQRLKNAGYDPLPTYKEPVESPTSTPDLAKKYPLVLNTGSREPMFVASRHRNNPWLRELHADPKVDMNPKDAAARGIKQRDNVIVEGPRGSIKVKANLTELAMPGVAHVYQGWEGDADINLICGRTFDPISGFPSFKSEICEVKKA
jgi:anaerobic selenocysteine-containing dehydrogenase